jgi:hypothetical protein
MGTRRKPGENYVLSWAQMRAPRGRDQKGRFGTGLDFHRCEVKNRKKINYHNFGVLRAPTITPGPRSSGSACFR